MNKTYKYGVGKFENVLIPKKNFLLDKKFRNDQKLMKSLQKFARKNFPKNGIFEVLIVSQRKQKKLQIFKLCYFALCKPTNTNWKKCLC